MMAQHRMLALIFGLCLAVFGVLLAPSSAAAASWLTLGENYGADWVKDIEHELNKDQYRAVFANDPRTPYPIVLRYLNNAAFALKANQEELARDEIRRAMAIFDDGVRKGYYSSTDIEPALKYMRTHMPIKPA